LALARQTDIGCGRFGFLRSRFAMDMMSALHGRAAMALVAVAM
jgi:hypothetical protein